MKSLHQENIVQAMKWSWISQMPAVLALQIARILIAIFLHRLFSARIWFRRSLDVMTTSNTIAAIVPLIMIFTQCQPAERLWGPAMPG